jgi:hypothetical protein
MQRKIKSMIVAEIFPLHNEAGSQILPLHDAAGSQILLPLVAAGSQFGSGESSLKTLENSLAS